MQKKEISEYILDQYPGLVALDALGKRPARPAAGGVVHTGYDFTQLNTLLPHPVYGWMSWVCVLNPDKAMIHDLAPLLDESYDLVVKKYGKRIKS